MTHLTPREKEIIGLVAQGFRDKEIARQLGTSPKTVGNQLTRIREKLGVTNRTLVAVFATEHGIGLDSSRI